MNQTFGPDQIVFLLESTRWTLVLTVTAFALGAVGGLSIALARVSDRAWLRRPAELWIGIIQGLPVLMVLFLSYYGLALSGYDVPPLPAACLALALYASAFLGDIWRGAIQAIPVQQWEAARALALSPWQNFRLVIIPQAARAAIPPTMGFLISLIKNTSVVAIVGFTELTRAGEMVNNATFQPFATFGVVAAIYFAICWPLSCASRMLERRLTYA